MTVTKIQSTIDMTPLKPQGLAERAMNVALHLSMWNGRKLDRQTTEEVLAERNASSDAGKFEKNLVPPSALEAVNKAHQEARKLHYRLTLPWGEDGVRILAAAAFFDYSEAMLAERGKCEAAYAAFCNKYPQLMQEAAKRLGTRLYNAADFPSPHSIRQRFGFELVLLPVPNKDDFRVDLGADLQSQIRESIEETVNKRYAEAQHDLWQRLLDTVKHFAGAMQEDSAPRKRKKTFRDTTVAKLGDLARLAPKLSLTPDPELEAICAEIINITNGVSAEDLRKSATLRKDSAAAAKAAVDKITKAMEGAFA